MQRVTKDIVVDDVRYISELQALKEAGFIIVRVSSPTKRLMVGKTLRPNTAKGRISLSEYFRNDMTAGYSADYNLLHEDKIKTGKIVDDLLDELRNKVV